MLISSVVLYCQVIHPSMAKGTWNAGLLATEAGTLGRFSGNIILSIAGHFTGIDSVAEIQEFAWLVHGMLAAMTGIALVCVAGVYMRLAV